MSEQVKVVPGQDEVNRRAAVFVRPLWPYLFLAIETITRQTSANCSSVLIAAVYTHGITWVLGQLMYDHVWTGHFLLS